MCLLGVIAADALLIGAAGLRPKIPMRSPITVVPLAPPPAATPVSDVAVVPPPPPKPKQTGVASWYGGEWQGRVTASGLPFDDTQLTAAHRTLPLNSRVKVTNLRNGRSVEVTIIDRGPYIHGRVIDLSEAAAEKLGMVKRGVTRVKIENEDENAS
ncbi:MAG TPA: septal ring lytic transglycosylase RlpA family protein [Stellaceae bacterium]|jgi:rare lipoprotein A